MKTIVHFSVLGPLRATDGGVAFAAGGPKQRAVLAMLVAGYGAPQSIESIIEAVWGQDTPSNTRRNVQTYVATLRSMMGDVIVKDSYGWRIDADRQQIDALAFEDLYESARTIIDTNPHRASVSLREALAMWRGHAFADVDLHGALDGEIARLTELRTAAQTARIEADLALGRDEDLVGEIEALLAEHPFSERIRSQHMLALYRSGRQREALQSFATMRQVLIEELGVEPSQDLQRLEFMILEQDADLAAAPLIRVTTRSVLVVDPGDAIDLARLPTDERSERLERNAHAIRSALVGVEADIFAAGSTSYVVTANTDAAVQAARVLVAGPAAQHLRLAIDSGEVVIDETRASGAPVTRAAVLAAVANEGQVLLTQDAQIALGAAADAPRHRFETLGHHQLQGIEGEVQIYQLLVDGQPEFGDLQLDRLPPALPTGLNQAVPGYELRESFGVGSIGVLHRAFQPSVGREVVVEVIGRTTASDATFVRNFEADAQRLALFDHQNITPVLDYWRRPEGAFIVHPFPRGGTLAENRSVDAQSVLGDVAAALSYAHSFGMVHGSLRPDRVLLDDVGNASLIGFPLARVAPTISTDFPAYAAPESLTGDTPTTQTDVFALGVLAHELLTGLVPPDGPLEAEHRAITQATSEDPADRYDTVADFMAELEPPTADQPTAHSRYTRTRNPYKGLAAFHEGDAGDFFGRSDAVEELVEALSRSTFLAILGPSGVGKSSVARAGLIPALRAGALPGAQDWMISDMVPGSHPFTELKRALQRVATDMPASLGEAIAARSPEALAGVIEALPERSELMIIIDQFEELFTLTGETERAEFLDLVTATAARGDVRFVITLRADFADRPLGNPEFAELFRRNVVLLRAPNRDELEEAIVRPAEGVGLVVESGLVERMIADVHEQSGALPLLQHALAELFDARESDVLTSEAYDRIGRIEGALARRADAICSHLDPDTLDSVRQALLRLTSMADDGRPTRRRTKLGDLDDLHLSDSLDAFVRSRLLVLDNDPETRSPTVEVAHEALLTEWPRLAAWIDAVRDDLVLSRRLAEACREWESSDRDDSHLLTGSRLVQLSAWTDDST
ncbi:MAG: protein kinase, partial [bacterium]|nr:protein kinase [bacterium]